MANACLRPTQPAELTNLTKIQNTIAKLAKQELPKFLDEICRNFEFETVQRCRNLFVSRFHCRDNWVGGVEVLFPSTRIASVRAESVVRSFFLPRVGLQGLMTDFPSTLELLKRRSRQREESRRARFHRVEIDSDYFPYTATVLEKKFMIYIRIHLAENLFK